MFLAQNSDEGFCTKISTRGEEKIVPLGCFINRSSLGFVSSLRFCLCGRTDRLWKLMMILSLRSMYRCAQGSGLACLLWCSAFPPVTTLRLVGFVLFCSSFSYCGIVVHLESDLGITLCFYHLFYSTDDTGIFKCLQKQKRLICKSQAGKWSIIDRRITKMLLGRPVNGVSCFLIIIEKGVRLKSFYLKKY